MEAITWTIAIASVILLMAGIGRGFFEMYEQNQKTNKHERQSN